MRGLRKRPHRVLPAFVNQNDLIKEALGEQGFIGFLLRDSNQQPFGLVGIGPPQTEQFLSTFRLLDRCLLPEA